jgi:hypothetical protein
MLYVPPERLFNDGSLNSITSWIFENLNLPPISRGAKLNLQALFDLNNGAVGFDNVQIHTKQK